MREWIITKAPLPLLTNAYEFVVSIVLTALALPVLVGAIAPDSIHAQVSELVARTWGIGVTFSGVTTLVGLILARPKLERLGQILLGWVLFLYGLAVLTNAGPQSGGLASAVFIALGLLGWWRAFKITSWPLVQARLSREADQALRRSATMASPRGWWRSR